MKKIIFCFLICTITVSCNDLFKVGNLVSLGYVVKTNIKPSIIRQYCDTLTLKYGFGAPYKWVHYDKLIDLDSIKNKRLYFRDDPEEMYLISSMAGVISIEDVFNPRIRDDGYVAERRLISATEEKRIRQRFKEVVLDSIEALCKKNGLPDSLIYKK